MTRHLKVDREAPDLAPLDEIATILLEGGIAAFPTETVYGLGAVDGSEEALRRLREIKGRSPQKPFTRLVADSAAAEELASEVPPAARTLMQRYWPGPLTLVLPARSGEPGATVGVRVPSDPVARHLVLLTGRPILAPSANPSGEPPATSADQVRAYFEGRIDAIVDAGPSPLEQSSTVVRIDPDGVEVLREGIITSAMVHQRLQGRSILFVCSGNTCRSPMAEALFRQHLARKLDKRPDELEELGYRIQSAGTFAAPGLPASEGSIEALRTRGCDLSTHRSQPVTEELLREADRIFTMTSSQLELLRRFDPVIATRARVITESGVPDPIGGDLDTYLRCADGIAEAVTRIVEET